MGGEQPKFELSVPQIGGSALAAVTAAVAASKLGVAGTVIGAAVVSVASTVGTAVYTHYLKRTGDQVIRRTAIVRRHQERDDAGQGALAAAVHATPPGSGRDAEAEEDATVVMPAVTASTALPPAAEVTAPLPLQAASKSAPMSAQAASETAPLPAQTAPITAPPSTAPLPAQIASETALLPAQPVPPDAPPPARGPLRRMPAWGKVAAAAGLVFGVSMGSILAYQGITHSTVHEQLTGQVPAAKQKVVPARRDDDHDPAPRASAPVPTRDESTATAAPATPSPSPTPTPSRTKATSTATPTPAPTGTRTQTGSARPTEPATSAPPEEPTEPDVVEEEPRPDTDEVQPH
ncbi:hypothetical protein JYK22_25480, partial [Nonomuraea sp. RK-328]|nr:hypothetical protein [Nonomuraea sp. RK-328]